MKTLDNMKNMFGKMNQNIKNKVIDYVNNPTVDKWDDIAHIIIDTNFKTIWQAVLEINPNFTKNGRVYDENGNIIKEWSEIPSPFEVIRAIKECLECNLNKKDLENRLK